MKTDFVYETSIPNIRLKHLFSCLPQFFFVNCVLSENFKLKIHHSVQVSYEHLIRSHDLYMSGLCYKNQYFKG